MSKKKSVTAVVSSDLVRRLRDGIPVKSIKEESGWEKTEHDLPAAIMLMMDAAEIIERLSHLAVGRHLEKIENIEKYGTRIKPCSDQGDGYWDCEKHNKCVNPQCDDCPQKSPNKAFMPQLKSE